jgi:energy-coupling factor transport system ATP-binding protein
MALNAEKISYYYPENPQQEVLRAVSFSLARGEIVGLIGPSGSGKSTLLQILGGLRQPQRGQVILDGTRLDAKQGPSRQDLAAKIGLVFQMPEKQLFERTVFADIAFGPKNIKVAPAQISERVIAAMQAVGLDDASFAGRSPLSLSSGEKRRVALAGVLALQPSYLLLDEPTAGLDGEGRQKILDILLRSRQEGIGILVVSHQMKDLMQIADRLLVLKNGQVLLQGTSFDVIRELEQQAYGGQGLTPSRRVLLQLMHKGWPLDADCGTPQQVAQEIIKGLDKTYENE